MYVRGPRRPPRANASRIATDRPVGTRRDFGAPRRVVIHAGIIFHHVSGVVTREIARVRTTNTQPETDQTNYLRVLSYSVKFCTALRFTSKYNYK